MNKEAIKSLYNFCVNELDSKPIKTEKGTGYVIYTIATAAQINELTTLVESVKTGWIVKEFDEDWDKGKKTKDASIYFGQAPDSGVSEDEFMKGFE